MFVVVVVVVFVVVFSHMHRNARPCQSWSLFPHPTTVGTGGRAESHGTQDPHEVSAHLGWPRRPCRWDVAQGPGVLSRGSVGDASGARSRERERREKERDEWERQYGRQSQSPSPTYKYGE